ncbi:MAG: hypothetical protein PVG79_04405 [Gemmatimonadales bacterium]|jgi:hypothetical protein
MFTQRTLLTCAAMLCLALPQSACTLIGYGIGSAIDAGSRHSLTPQNLESETIEPGRKITLQLRDGDIVDGAYFGIEQLPAYEYAARYAAARERQPSAVPLPALDDTVTVCMARGGELDAEFLGFDLYRVSVRSLGSTEPGSLMPQEVAELRAPSGAAITGETLALLVSEGALPFRSAVAMRMPPAIGRTGGRRLVPLDQVKHIEWTSGSGAQKTGLIVGAVLDIAALTAFAVCAATDCLEMSFAPS